MLGKRERLSTQLARQLARKITTHAYPPGEKIPTEAELCSEYGVSRTVVREAIASMRAEGLLESRQGVGVFVSSGMRRLPFALVSDADGRLTDILQILELRLSVEVEGAGLAAERHSAAALRTIKARLRDIDKELRTATGDRGRADFELHVAIARATSNPYFEKFLAFIGPVIIPRERFGALRDDRLSDQQYHAELQAEHGRVVDAIASRDVAAARDAMRSHLSAALMRYRAHY
ncbi:FadR/GntR family transcriptional regulator [Bosea sp. (in: a-proteobacteria)]|uniref:FadR/GntR family transcriptional regulator n=1 Tax=Bosea sp. (in: a-proteobacteria) TaxID=1871050 RepID=UPI002FC87408